MPKIHQIIALAAVLLAQAAAARALPAEREPGRIIVTATKSETSLDNVSTNVTVITREQIIRRGHRDAFEALRDAVGFDIAQSGGPGGVSAPQLRGLPGKHFVVLINGVRANDPADANGGVGTLFSHIQTADIERIEVVRGSQSPLYGSNANTGVINIITRAGSGDGELGLSYEGGSLGSHRVDAGYGIEHRGFRFRAGQQITDTDGVIDKETYSNYTTSVKLGYGAGGLFDWSTLVRYTAMDQNYAEFNESFSGPFWTEQTPDPNQENDFSYLTVANRLRHDIRPFWSHELNFGINRRNRDTRDPDDGLLGYRTAVADEYDWDGSLLYEKGDRVPIYDVPYGETDYTYTGANYQLDYRHTFYVSGANVSDIFTTGAEYLYQDYDQSGTVGELSNSIATTSAYFHNQMLLAGDALSINTGARYDSHEQAGGSTTGLLGAAWDIRRAGLVLRGNVGSAFRSPSIFELYSPSYGGNPDLDPEESTTWEAGLEKYFAARRLSLSLSVWRTEVDGAIVWAWTGPGAYDGMYQNVDKAESNGVEAEIRAEPAPGWRAGFNYTYTDSRKYSASEDNWSRNVQVPYNKLNLNLTRLIGERGSVALEGYWVDGSRLRWNGQQKMDSYFKLDLTARHPLGSHFTGSLRVRNLLDEDYVEAIGYREQGIAVYAGIEMSY